MSITDNPRTRRYVLGVAVTALGAASIPATAQSDEQTTTPEECGPDGQIITFPDCETAVIEGTQWDQIMFGGATYSPENGPGDFTEAVEPDESGITVINGRDYSYGEDVVLEDVSCLIHYEDTSITAAERVRDRESDCYDAIRTPNEKTTETETETETETTTSDPFSPNVTFNGCNSVTVSNEEYTIATLLFTDGTTQKFEGRWDGEETFFGTKDNAGKQIDGIEVSDGTEAIAAHNPENCETESEPDTTTTEEIYTLQEEPDTEQEQEPESEETTNNGLLDWLFGLFT